MNLTLVATPTLVLEYDTVPKMGRENHYSGAKLGGGRQVQVGPVLVHSRSQSPCTKKGSVAKVLALKNVVVQEFAERSHLKLCGVTEQPFNAKFLQAKPA